jgi:hypothetical protein
MLYSLLSLRTSDLHFTSSSTRINCPSAANAVALRPSASYKRPPAAEADTVVCKVAYIVRFTCAECSEHKLSSQQHPHYIKNNTE